tara:strand:- start:1319 stop:1555 length:237 start_codon:yes stop_codon:yes gene_type:complete
VASLYVAAFASANRAHHGRAQHFRDSPLMLAHSGRTDAVSWSSENFENGITSFAALSDSRTKNFKIQFVHIQQTKKGN